MVVSSLYLDKIVPLSFFDVLRCNVIDHFALLLLAFGFGVELLDFLSKYVQIAASLSWR